MAILFRSDHCNREGTSDVKRRADHTSFGIVGQARGHQSLSESETYVTGVQSNLAKRRIAVLSPVATANGVSDHDNK